MNDRDQAHYDNRRAVWVGEVTSLLQTKASECVTPVTLLSTKSKVGFAKENRAALSEATGWGSSRMSQVLGGRLRITQGMVSKYADAVREIWSDKHVLAAVVGLLVRRWEVLQTQVLTETPHLRDIAAASLSIVKGSTSAPKELDYDPYDDNNPLRH